MSPWYWRRAVWPGLVFCWQLHFNFLGICEVISQGELRDLPFQVLPSSQLSPLCPSRSLIWSSTLKLLPGDSQAVSSRLAFILPWHMSTDQIHPPSYRKQGGQGGVGKGCREGNMFYPFITPSLCLNPLICINIKCNPCWCRITVQHYRG